MTAAATRPWSVNQRAARAVVWATRIDDDTPAPDARDLLELLGLIAADGDELLLDDTQVYTREGLELELGSRGPQKPVIVREPPDPRDHVPAGLRNLAPLPAKRATAAPKPAPSPAPAPEPIVTAPPDPPAAEPQPVATPTSRRPATARRWSDQELRSAVRVLAAAGFTDTEIATELGVPRTRIQRCRKAA